MDCAKTNFPKNEILSQMKKALSEGRLRSCGARQSGTTKRKVQSLVVSVESEISITVVFFPRRNVTYQSYNASTPVVEFRLSPTYEVRYFDVM